MRKARYRKGSGAFGWTLSVDDEETGMPIRLRGNAESTTDFLFRSYASLPKEGYALVGSDDLHFFPLRLHGWDRIGVEIYHRDDSSVIELYYTHPRFTYMLNVCRHAYGTWSVYLEEDGQTVNCRLKSGTKEEALHNVTDFLRIDSVRQYL